jgi:hypothetical protein
MRSDAQLQLDQSIAPDWTGFHTFTTGVRFGGNTDPAPDAMITFNPNLTTRVLMRCTLTGAGLLTAPVPGSLECDTTRLWWTFPDARGRKYL